MTHDDKWHVGYYTMEANYSNGGGAAGGYWPAMGGGGGPSNYQPPVVSTWHFLSDHSSEHDAMDRVNYLNGGAVVV
jgi:hypothetical protein